MSGEIYSFGFDNQIKILIDNKKEAIKKFSNKLIDNAIYIVNSTSIKDFIGMVNESEIYPKALLFSNNQQNLSLEEKAYFDFIANKNSLNNFQRVIEKYKEDESDEFQLDELLNLAIELDVESKPRQAFSLKFDNAIASVAGFFEEIINFVIAPENKVAFATPVMSQSLTGIELIEKFKNIGSIEFEIAEDRIIQILNSTDDNIISIFCSKKNEDSYLPFTIKVNYKNDVSHVFDGTEEGINISEKEASGVSELIFS